MAEAEQSSGNSESIDSLASFLVDNPDADGSGPAKEDEDKTQQVTGEDADTIADEEASGTEGEDADDQDAEEGTEDKGEADQQQGLKFKVPIKGDDGTDTTVEVDQKELIAGYQRQADYTRKTQDLSKREQEVTQQVAERLNKGLEHYMQQAQMAHSAIAKLAGLRSAEEMAQLAVSNPAEWIQEQQRATAVSSVLAQIEQGMQAELQKHQAEQTDAQKKAYYQAWEVLTKDGIDKPKLKKIFDTMQEHYKVPAHRLQNLYDPILVRIMRDAAAYRDIQARKTEVTKKVVEAPRLPAARQSVPRQERINKQLNARFAKGKAKLDDLAAYLSANNL